MHVVIESPVAVSEARRLLANVVVREALGALSKHIESVRFRLPVARGGERARCELEVQLTSGVKLESEGAAESMADAFELATHEMRRRVFGELGLPLPARSGQVASDASAERRAS